MATSPMSEFIRRLRGAMLLRDGAGLTDGRLLEEYVSRRDETALATLVRRHAAMVWGVCRRVLRDPHDAEDAFQATFLVLVRRAASIASPELLANWLYGVAHQTALKARATRTRRRTREKQVTDMPDPAAPEQPLWDDLRPLLDRELTRLPDKYRAAIILCDLEGKTRTEAARHLGVPGGTLAARLARGRGMLAARLARRGLAVSATALALALSRGTAAAAATVPAPLVATTVRALTSAGASGAGSGALAHVVALAEGTARGMSWAVLKPVSVLVLGLGAFAAAGSATYQLAGTPPQAESVRQSAHPAPPPAVAGPAAAPVANRRRLRGVWRVVASEMDGVKDFDKGRGHDRLVFAGDRVAYWARKGSQEGRFRLDTAKTPNEIDIDFDGGGVLKGIYEFDGARLRFCWTKGGRRPASFDTSAGELLTFLYTYEKEP
jgi:RNA polymerase sigma factor (sigma-70 family)